MSIEVKVTGSSKSFEAWFQESVNEIMADVNDIVADAIEEGGNITKHNIETRGTAKSGKRGRIETGKMRDAVNSQMVKSGTRDAEGKFGWIDGYEDYYGYQEGGFEHVGGVTVEGMYALTDAGEEVWQNVVDDVKRVK